MELLVFILCLALLAALAMRFGHDSRPGFDDASEAMRQDHLVITDDGDRAVAFPTADVRREAAWRHWYRHAHA